MAVFLVLPTGMTLVCVIPSAARDLCLVRARFLACGSE
jgi:hypothetical protein